MKWRWKRDFWMELTSESNWDMHPGRLVHNFLTLPGLTFQQCIRGLLRRRVGCDIIDQNSMIMVHSASEQASIIGIYSWKWLWVDASITSLTLLISASCITWFPLSFKRDANLCWLYVKLGKYKLVWILKHLQLLLLSCWSIVMPG